LRKRWKPVQDDVGGEGSRGERDLIPKCQRAPTREKETKTRDKTGSRLAIVRKGKKRDKSHHITRRGGSEEKTPPHKKKNTHRKTRSVSRERGEKIRGKALIGGKLLKKKYEELLMPTSYVKLPKSLPGKTDTKAKQAIRPGGRRARRSSNLG